MIISKHSELISIIIPLYNRENLILETIDSLYKQTFKNWEAIIVDDGSTDTSYKQVEKEAKKDQRIRLSKRELEPKGAPTCRNIGIEKSKGEYVIFLDSDDLIAPYCLEERIKCFETLSHLDFLVFNSSFFTNKMGDTPILWNVFTNENNLDRFLRGDVVWCISSPIWKRESLINNNLRFNENAKSSQDWEFHVKALLKKLAYKGIDGLPDFFVRRSPLQASNAISSGHSNFNKIKNRISIYKTLFENYMFTKSQKKMLFKNVNKEIFNSYNKFSIKKLKVLRLHIKETNMFSAYIINSYSVLYCVLYILSKLTLNRSHQLYYYYKRSRKSKSKTGGYRSDMKGNEYKDLLLKIKCTSKV